MSGVGRLVMCYLNLLHAPIRRNKLPNSLKLRSCEVVRRHKLPRDEAVFQSL